MQQMYASIGLSLILLLVGAQCAPLQRRSSEDVAPQQPSHCRQSRPKSTTSCNDDAKVRRYFYHTTHLKGCKLFSLCPEDVAFHDNQTSLGGSNYFLNFADCQKECMDHVTCPELEVGENMVVVSDNGLQGWGHKVVYQCSSGYSLSDNSAKNTRTCQKNGTWSGTTPTCLKQCQAPPPVSHSYIAPSMDLHSQGSAVHYTCHVGYQLRGSAQRTCGSNGEWTNPEPTCVCQVASSTDTCPSCPEPSPIENGQVSAPNRSLYAALDYVCDEGYVLVGDGHRVCEENGVWSGEEPICWRLNLVRKETEHNNREDVTNQTVTLSMGLKGVTFMAVSSFPNPFPDMEPEWTFDGSSEFPPRVEQQGLDLVFDTILMSPVQRGIYTITFGNYSAFFKLNTREAPQEIIAPEVVIHPSPMTSHTGGVATFSCVLSGCPVPDVEWYHGNEVVKVNDRVRTDMIKSHEVVAGHLTILNLQEQDSGSYHCKGTTDAGNATTNIVELTVEDTTRRKRSIEEDTVEPSEDLCQNSKDTVSLVGQVRRELRQLRSSASSGMTNYRVQVRRFLGRPETSKRFVRVVVLDPKLSSSPEERLSESVDYVFRGRMVNNMLFVSRKNVQRHSEKLEEIIKSC